MENGVTENQLQRGGVLSENTITKPKNVDFFRVPDELWETVKRLLPSRPERKGPGRPRADVRIVEEQQDRRTVKTLLGVNLLYAHA